MSSPADLDALLVGALYGELSPAERGRLDAHLAVHPGDRAALTALTEAHSHIRQLGRACGYLGVTPSGALLLEPASAVSARLVQTAAQQAPRPGLWASLQGWFAQLGRSPAWAAATMLVVVAGVAGIMYSRGGGVAEPTAKLDSSSSMGDLPAAPSAGAPAAAFGMASGSSDKVAGYPAGLVEPPREEQDGAAPAQRAKEKQDGRAGLATGPQAASDEAVRRDPARPIALGFADGELALKDLDDRDADKTESGVGGVYGDVKPPAPATRATDPAGPSATTPAKPGADEKPAPDAAVADDARARALHGQVVKLAQAGKCADAARLARSIADRHADYYLGEVATDRRLRACKPYLDREIDPKKAPDATPKSSDSK